METSRKKVIELNIEDILPNRFQPRIKFSEDAINELSKSIKEHGVIQPIVVRPIGDKFEIIAGERRYKASALAGLTKIPAIIRNLDDKEASKVLNSTPEGKLIIDEKHRVNYLPKSQVVKNCPIANKLPMYFDEFFVI